MGRSDRCTCFPLTPPSCSSSSGPAARRRSRASMPGLLVFVTGGTGAIGGHALPALVSAGHQVSALARSPVKAGWLRRHGATPVEASRFDPRALAEAFAGHEVGVNLAT